MPKSFEEVKTEWIFARQNIVSTWYMTTSNWERKKEKRIGCGYTKVSLILRVCFILFWHIHVYYTFFFYPFLPHAIWSTALITLGVCCLVFFVVVHLSYFFHPIYMVISNLHVHKLPKFDCQNYLSLQATSFGSILLCFGLRSLWMGVNFIGLGFHCSVGGWGIKM